MHAVIRIALVSNIEQRVQGISVTPMFFLTKGVLTLAIVCTIFSKAICCTRGTYDNKCHIIVHVSINLDVGG